MMGNGELYLDINLHNWFRKVARREHWRVANTLTLEELVAEGYLCFAKCWDKYRVLFDVSYPTEGQIKHLRSLTQRTFINHIRDLAKKSRYTVSLELFDDCQGTKSILEAFERHSPVHPHQDLYCALAGAPAEIAELLRKLGQDVVDTAKYLQDKTPDYHTRRTTAAYWRQATGERKVTTKLEEFIYAS